MECATKLTWFTVGDENERMKRHTLGLSLGIGLLLIRGHELYEILFLWHHVCDFLLT